MAFSNDFTFCQKLGYLITQWQAKWELLPTSVEHRLDTEDPLSSYYYRTTNNTLIKGSSTEIRYEYKEKLFSSKEFAADIVFYNKICKDIAACLGKNWESSSEEIEEKISDYSKETRHRSVTHFFIKGAKGQPYKSFEVYRTTEFGAGLNLSILGEVQLVFN